MAEVVVGLVTVNVVSWIDRKAKLLRGVGGEVEQIIEELKSIQSFIKDADKKAEKEEADDAASWVQSVREAAYQIEDFTDTYVMHMATEAQHHHCRPKILGSLIRAMCWILKLKSRQQIVHDIIKVKEGIRVIKERGQSYGFSSSSSAVGGSSRRDESWHDPRVTSLFIEEAEVVGIEPHRDGLIDWLINGGSKRTVISIVGMGGLGKTTLASKVYDTDCDKSLQQSSLKPFCSSFL